MAEEEKPPGGKKLPPKPPLPPRRAATASALEKKDLEKAAVLSKTRHSTSFGINDDEDQDVTAEKKYQQTSEKLSKPSSYKNEASNREARSTRANHEGFRLSQKRSPR